MLLALKAAFLRRDPYLRMVVASDGVADGAMIVAAVYAALVLIHLGDGFSGFLLVRVVLDGLFKWIVLSGLVYLAGRHLLEGDGSFPSTMAATSIGFPVILLALALRLVVSVDQAEFLASLWLMLTTWVAARVALELDPGRAAVAAGLGWAGYLIILQFFSV